jgi:hypothetical protein
MGTSSRLRKVLGLFLVIISPFQVGILRAQEDCSCPTIPETVIFDEEWHPIDVSQEEIPPGGGVNLNVSFGGTPCPPFSWGLEGTGFVLGALATGNGENQLQASSSACGTAKSTVVDACQRQATGYVRSTRGQWVQETLCSESPYGGYAYYSTIVGPYQYEYRTDSDRPICCNNFDSFKCNEYYGIATFPVLPDPPRCWVADPRCPWVGAFYGTYTIAHVFRHKWICQE